MRYLPLIFVVVALASDPALAQDKVFSGPQPGEETKPFKVMQVTDAETVEETEYASSESDGPTLICFMHKVSEPALGLFITLEFYASKQESINQHLVLLTDDRDETEKMLKGWAARSFFSKAKMSYSAEGIEGPGDYGLNRNVTATILIANRNKVVKNFAYQDPNNEDAEEILTALAATAGQEKPSIEEIRKEIRARRDQRRAMRMKENPVFELAPDKEIGQLMMRMLYVEGDLQANANRRVKQMIEWAGDSEEKRTALKKYCREILEGEIETNEYSRKSLMKLAEVE